MPETQKPEIAKKLYLVDGVRLTLCELLWLRMSGIYGHKWTSSFGDEPIDSWESAMFGITPAMVKTGLVRMAKSSNHVEWPPGALEFRQLCLPRSEDIGLPSLMDAFHQAIGVRSIKHPSVVYTLQEMGHLVYTMRREKEASAQRMFSEWWERTIVFVVDGGVLPPVANELPNKRYRANPEVGRRAVDNMMAILSGQDGAL